MIAEMGSGMPFIAYLFLASIGVAAALISAGITLGAGVFGASRFAIARCGALLAPVPMTLGGGLLIIDHFGPFGVHNVLAFFDGRFTEAGGWFAALFFFLTIVYAASYLPRSATIGDQLDHVRRALAGVYVLFTLGGALYAAPFLGTLPRYSFWNSPAVAPLFVLGALAGGVAAIALVKVLSRESRAGVDTENCNEQNGGTETMVLASELIAILLFTLVVYLSISSARGTVSITLHTVFLETHAPAAARDLTEFQRGQQHWMNTVTTVVRT